ncbi:hypothetical protein BDV18DRAFT_90414 [Aspergillus unguis]
MGQGSSQLEHGENGEFQDDADGRPPQQNSVSPTTVKGRKSDSQKENGINPKRKRKSSQSNPDPLPSASSEAPPKALKRKRIIDNLAEEDVRATARKNESERKVSNSQESPASRADGPTTTKAFVARPLKSPASAVRAREFKMSPSPALSTASSQAKGRLKRTNGDSNGKGATGAFKPEEVEALEDYKVQFCNSHGCSTAVFDLMIQHGTEGPFPGPGVKKRNFWSDIHKVLPDRDRRSVYRFMKRHFQASGQKPHEWTKEQEDELVVLYQQHGPKFAQIAEMLGRSSDDVVQRWKNRLEHRATMKIGVWSDAELRQLKHALRDAWARMKEEGYDVGENIYQMDESLISWSQISNSMQNTRSRQQCADKWRRVKSLTAGPGSQPNSRANSRANSRSVTRSVTPSSTKKPHAWGYISATYVKSDDDDSDVEENSEERGRKSAPARSGKASPSRTPNRRFNTSNLADAQSGNSQSDSNSSSESSDSSSDSESEMQPKLKSKPTSVVNKQDRNEGSSSSSSESDSDDSSSSDSDSEAEADNDSKPATTLQRAAAPAKESFSDGSEEEEESDDDNENTSDVPTRRPAEQTTKSTSQGSKRKHEGSLADEADVQDYKAVRIKDEPKSSPNIGSENHSESDSDSDSDSDDESGSSSESESEAESDNEQKVAIENTPDNQNGNTFKNIKMSGSQSDSTSSDSDSSSDGSDIHDDPSDDEQNVKGDPESSNQFPHTKQEGNASSDSSSEDSSDPESDSDSE